MFLAMESISVSRDAQGHVQHYVSVFTDVTQLKAHEHELDHVAHYDALTDLPNRRLLSDRPASADGPAPTTGPHDWPLDHTSHIDVHLRSAVGRLELSRGGRVIARCAAGDDARRGPRAG